MPILQSCKNSPKRLSLTLFAVELYVRGVQKTITTNSLCLKKEQAESRFISIGRLKGKFPTLVSLGFAGSKCLVAAIQKQHVLADHVTV
jgi:hypothetical protein